MQTKTGDTIKNVPSGNIKRFQIRHHNLGLNLKMRHLER